MNISDITNISLGMILGNLNLLDLQKKYEEQFNVIKYIRMNGIGCQSSNILSDFNLPTLSELFTNFYNKKYKLTKNDLSVYFGRTHKFGCDAILFGILTIPFENGENESRFPFYDVNESSLSLLDEDGLVLRGITINEHK